ncbi:MULTISPECIES: glutathione S-transferase family protein [Rhodopseudomonas]|uniref:Glutathionyl-hydroquinone reductase YqjG n=1 Tax=Rhodopseudomonas palustris TaxID=1076 RepID=A0A0D7ET19_RHOPL|nr:MULTISPECIES: glutathione S-transferase family protein [Rhodopseudomonas]KIZ42592.1 glutathionyl-hydroquinone reductase YqjG [Rhodopseudomonas palustris]MDF3812470.1 glutathione S-transferase family protein [Rhodopseudomonas sp. BAL398]WOK19468.1 glutathione S-transferase family protein [Rhodopseudomonas sp. BAL398]
MGALIDGRWTTDRDEIENGTYQRKPTSFRHQISNEPGAKYPAEPGRYHLYVSLACPWACRTLMVRKLKKLEDVISVTIVHPDMMENGWTFGDTPEPINGFRFLHEVYVAALPSYSGHVTVPVLWDRKTGTIVNNESAEIIRMMNSAFDSCGDASVDLYPAALAGEIDALNAVVYETVNNGVYRAGFAASQAAYQDAVWKLFKTLDDLETRLARQRYLMGAAFTEADVRLFTTGVRFDLVYYTHFKCNVKHWWDYPNLDNWLRDIYQMPGIAETVDLDHIKRHYYFSQRWVNPSGIVAAGPSIDLRKAHDRHRFAQ